MTFKRVAFLRGEKQFTDHEIAVTAGISSRLAAEHLKLLEKYKNHGIAQHRMEQIRITGSEYYRETGEKKDSQFTRESSTKWSQK